MGRDLKYIPGSFYRVCDRTGFPTRAGKTRPEWTQHIVRVQSWEPRQPQDFVRGVPDDQTVPDARPLQANIGIGPITTTLNANALAGATVLTLASIAGMYVGDQVTIILDNGSTAYGLITLIDPAAITVTLQNPLPYAASSGNTFTDLTSYVNALLPGYILEDDRGDVLVGGRVGPPLVSP